MSEADDFYLEMQQIAADMIREYGRELILRKPGGATGPDWDPQPGQGTDTTIFGVQSRFSSQEMASGLYSATDVKFVIEAGKVVPSKDMLILDGDNTWVVRADPEVRPGYVPVVYFLQASK